MNVDCRGNPQRNAVHIYIAIGYKKALITGNPMSALTRVEVGHEVDMGVSVYVKDNPLHKSDYVTHYAVKATMAVEEYVSIYDNKTNYTPTLFQLREKDYMYLNNKEEYWIDE